MWKHKGLKRRHYYITRGECFGTMRKHKGLKRVRHFGVATACLVSCENAMVSKQPDRIMLKICLIYVNIGIY